MAKSDVAAAAAAAAVSGLIYNRQSLEMSSIETFRVLMTWIVSGR